MIRQAKMIFVVVLIIISMGMSISYAKDEDIIQWTIDTYEAIVAIKPDGSIAIEEYIKYDFKKNFSGTLARTIDTSSASEVEGLEIFTIEEMNDDISKSKLTPLEPSSYHPIIDEDYGIMEGVSLSIEPETRDKYLVYKYKLNDAIGIYNDMALLDWMLLDYNEQFSNKEIVVNVKFPAKVNENAVQGLLEGPIYTESNIDEDILEYKGHLFKNNKDIRILMLLPTSFIPHGRKIIDNDIAQKVQGWISQYENEIAEFQREYGTRRWIWGIMLSLGFGISILTFAYIYIKFGKNHRITIGDTVQKHLPTDYYTPAELGALMNKGKIQSNYIAATLIDLCNRDHLYIEDAGDSGFAISINKDANTKELKSYEEYLLGWIFGDIGQGSSKVKTNEISKWNNAHGNRKRYKHKHRTWVSLVNKYTKRWKFFEQVDKARTIGLISGMITLLSGIILAAYDGILPGIIIMGLSIILMVYSRFIFKPTEFGAINIAKWSKIKELIKDGSTHQNQIIEDRDYEKLLGYLIPLNSWNDILIYLENYYGSGGLMNDRDVLIHKKNLEKTREFISSMEEKGCIFRPLQKIIERGFDRGSSIDT